MYDNYRNVKAGLMAYLFKRGDSYMSFMNSGMQNKKQKKAVTIIVGIVILSFLVSIVAVAFY